MSTYNRAMTGMYCGVFGGLALGWAASVTGIPQELPEQPQSMDYDHCASEVHQIIDSKFPQAIEMKARGFVLADEGLKRDFEALLENRAADIEGCAQEKLLERREAVAVSNAAIKYPGLTSVTVDPNLKYSFALAGGLLGAAAAAGLGLFSRRRYGSSSNRILPMSDKDLNL